MNNPFCFVLFPQAKEPSMNFNISKMVYCHNVRATTAFAFYSLNSSARSTCLPRISFSLAAES